MLSTVALTCVSTRVKQDSAHVMLMFTPASVGDSARVRIYVELEIVDFSKTENTNEGSILATRVRVRVRFEWR